MQYDINQLRARAFGRTQKANVVYCPAKDYPTRCGSELALELRPDLCAQKMQWLHEAYGVFMVCYLSFKICLLQ